MKFNELQFNDFGGAICLLAVRKNWRFYSKTILEKQQWSMANVELARPP